jgi:hypothetical protein
MSEGKQVFLTGSDSLRSSVASVQEAMRLIEMGTRARSVAPTKVCRSSSFFLFIALTSVQLNQVSSRAHSIISFTVEQLDRAGCVLSSGKLHLVDLAGSERLSKSGGMLTAALPLRC